MRIFLKLLITVVLPFSAWANICAFNDAVEDPAAVLAICFPDEYRNKKCPDDPIEWNIQLYNFNKKERKLKLSDKPRTFWASFSGMGLVYSPIQIFNLADGESVNLYIHGNNINMAISKDKWCNAINTTSFNEQILDYFIYMKDVMTSIIH